ncbi:MAG: DUF4294 domain-containing protein [Salibacteraceae bacterium]
MVIRITLCILVVIISAANESRAQGKGIPVIAEIIDGDTVPVHYLPYVNIVADRNFRSEAERRRFNRLQYNVKKVYPYAKLAGQLLEKYSAEIANVESERERKKYFKMIEEELKAEFDDDLRNMNTTQGRILIKLIDRETGHTSYEIVEELRGTFTAFFWQGVSRLFGHNLKSRYDPYGEDREIEQIVQMIEAGII